MAHYASFVSPSASSWLGAAREPAAGRPTAPAVMIPVDGDSYQPEDTPAFVQDTGLRESMAVLFGEVLGTEDGTFSFAGPAYLDVDGYLLDNVFGDLSTVSNGTLGTAQALSAGLPIGATSLAVGSSLGAVVTGSVIQISDGAASETVIATAGSTGTAVNFTGTPCRFAHSTLTATAALETAALTYTHTWAALNNGTGQPPTHSLCDYTGITAGSGARIYPGSCISELGLSGDAGNLLSRKFAGLSWMSSPAAATPVKDPPAAAPVANWRCSMTVGGTPVYNVGAWNATFRRQLQAYWSAQGSQSPWYIVRGGLSASFTLDYTPAVDESPLTALTSGEQSLALSLSNGLAGASLLSLGITASKAQAVRAYPVRSGAATGYSTAWNAHGNTTDAGGSGGMGPCTVTITNSIAAY